MGPGGRAFLQQPGQFVAAAYECRIDLAGSGPGENLALCGLDRFPEGKYADVTGLCKAAKLAGEDGVVDQDYSLNPGRYVGVVIEDDGMTKEEFKAEMLSLDAELAKLGAEARELEQKISENLRGLAK